MILICFAFNCAVFDGVFAKDIETQQKETRAKIKKLKWLENVEQNKLYKNQQKLENAKTTLVQSENQVASARKELSGMQNKLEQATTEYNKLN